MGEEIERKWIVWIRPANLSQHVSEHFSQGYLPVTNLDDEELRIRREGECYFLTMKIGEGISRGEFPIEIPEETFNHNWSLAKGRRIRKTRYHIPDSVGKPLELDEYLDGLAGHMTAEKEFDSIEEARAYQPSEWLRRGKEVTGDKRYKNRNLAENGWPE